MPQCWRTKMSKLKERKCAWCGKPRDRVCRICLPCCDARDAKNALIDEGKAPYVPPHLRPGHRLYQAPERKEARKVAAAKAQATKKARQASQEAQGLT